MNEYGNRRRQSDLKKNGVWRRGSGKCYQRTRSGCWDLERKRLRVENELLVAQVDARSRSPHLPHLLNK